MLSENLTILINGATGVGKTETAASLSRKLMCSTISTDDVRQRLRWKCTLAERSLLLRSSYETDVASTQNKTANVFANYASQAALVVREIRNQQWRSRHKSTIIEGVHLNPAALSMLASPNYIVLFLRMPRIKEHKRRLETRNSKKRGMNGKHIVYFDNIRAIGDYLSSNWIQEARSNDRIIFVDERQDVDMIMSKIMCRVS